jgi:hypothetical protein
MPARSRTTKTGPTADPGNPTPLPPGSLSLDEANPRLAGQNLQNQDDILAWLWKHKAVREVLDSIAASGYWKHEELFAARESGKLVVIEGNRRLAAVKILLEPRLQKLVGLREPPKLSTEVLGTIKELPVIVATRESLWEYVGFKHVNGPQEWDSIAKAEYIHRVHTQFRVPIDRIASTIGDNQNVFAKRVYRGYVVLKQAEDAGLFSREDSYQPKFPFSHLWTALGYSAVQTFLGLTPQKATTKNPVPKAKQENLRDLMLWLFGSGERNIEPRIRQQNPDLRRLVDALDSPRGLKVLRAGLPLRSALEASRGDAILLEEALERANDELRNAKRYVATGFSGDQAILDTATAIEAIAASLVKEMNDAKPATVVSRPGRAGRKRL